MGAAMGRAVGGSGMGTALSSRMGSAAGPWGALEGRCAAGGGGGGAAGWEQRWTHVGLCRGATRCPSGATKAAAMDRTPRCATAAFSILQN